MVFVMRTSFFKQLVALFFGAWVMAMPVWADPGDTPDGLVKFVVEDVMNTIRNDKALQSGDLRKIHSLVDQKNPAIQ